MVDVVWTRQRIAECPVDQLPDGMSRWRKKKNQTWEGWRSEILMRIDNGGIDLTPKKKKGKKGEFEKRKSHTLTALTQFGVKDEEEQRRYARTDYESPHFDNLVTDTEKHQNEQEEYSRGGLWSLRNMFSLVVRDTIELKLEEANCNLECVRCPAGQVLACTVENLSMSLEEGYDMQPLLMGSTLEDINDGTPTD